MTLPVAVGTTVPCPFTDCAPENVPPDMLEALAVQDVALFDDQASCTAWPRLTLIARAGVVNDTVGGGVVLPP
jgi:hypothetical protein